MTSDDNYITPVASSDYGYEEIPELGDGEYNQAQHLELFEDPTYEDIGPPDEAEYAHKCDDAQFVQHEVQDHHHYAGIQQEGGYEQLQKDHNPPTESSEMQLEESVPPESHCCQKMSWWNWAILVIGVILLGGMTVIGLQVGGLLSGAHQVAGVTSAGPTKSTTEKKTSTTRQPLPTLWQDCEEAQTQGQMSSGVYKISPDGGATFHVFCEMDIYGGGWTVIQRRSSRDVDFYRGWTDYKTGFGAPSGNHWAGNEVIHRLTGNRNQSLRIVLKNRDGKGGSVIYGKFYIDGGEAFYRVHVSNVSRSPGNTAYISSQLEDDLAFTTYDADHDKWNEGNCAQWYHSAWWFRKCGGANLNGRFGVIWREGTWWWSPTDEMGFQTPLTHTTMMVKGSE